MSRPTRRPTVTGDWYSSRTVHDAKQGLLSQWHPTWAALTPIEWIQSSDVAARVATNKGDDITFITPTDGVVTPTNREFGRLR